jgi:ribosomal protein L31
MKSQIHPVLIETIVQTKHGSVYWKKWTYYRSVLNLESDFLFHKVWNKKNKKKNVNNFTSNT